MVPTSSISSIDTLPVCTIAFLYYRLSRDTIVAIEIYELIVSIVNHTCNDKHNKGFNGTIIGKPWEIHTKIDVYPLAMTNIAIEHGHGNSEFSHQKLRLSIIVLAYRMVTTENHHVKPE